MRSDTEVLIDNTKETKRVRTWEQLAHDCEIFARACIKVGAPIRSSVNIIGFNSPEWFIAYLGAMCANFISAGVYTTNKSDACSYIAEGSEASIIIVENREQLAKYEPEMHKLQGIKAVVVYGERPHGSTDPRVYDWAEFMKFGEEEGLAAEYIE